MTHDRAAQGRSSPRKAMAFPFAVLALGVAGLVCCCLMAPRPAHAMAITDIDIDGVFDDWVGPLRDTDNVIADQAGAEDPDNPPQGDRDIVHMAAAFNDEYLFVYWARSTSVNRSVEYIAYCDVDGDNKMEDGEPVVCWGFNGSTFTPNASSSGVGAYEAVASQGDTLTPNGVDMPGSVSALSLDASTTGMGDGLKYEVRVPWSSLGFTDSDPPPAIRIHFACGQNLNLPTGVTDNGGNIWTSLYRDLTIEPDQSSGASVDATVTYTHTITNGGNTTETVLLTANSSRGWATLISKEPSGSAITSITLGPEESTTVVISIKVGESSPDETTIYATSSDDSATVDTAVDTTYVGALTLIPDRQGSTAASTTISYQHTVSNNGSTAQTISLSATSSQGWPTGVYSIDGSPSLSSVYLGAGESTVVVVRIVVPSTAGTGTQDVTTVRAELESDHDTYDTATDITTVRQGLTLEPDNAAPAGPSTTISYDHVITNSWPVTRTIEVTSTSSHGWPTRIYASDGITQITSMTLGPNGDTGDLIVCVFVPAGTGGLIDTTTVTAYCGAVSDTAIDVTTVAMLATYGDALYESPDAFFIVGETVYTRGMGLTGYSNVKFRWIDASTTRTVYVSPEIGVDAAGMASSSYSIPTTALVGTWRLELLDPSDGDAVITWVTFVVSDSGAITALYATDAPGLGSTVSVDATVTNSGVGTISASTVTYVMWWDNDSDGVFDASDTYIDSAGLPHTWDGTSTVLTHQDTGIDVGPGASWSDAAWTVSNTDFPYKGTYKVTATWKSSAGTVIDTKTTQFYSVPALGAALVAFIAALMAPVLWALRRRRRWLTYYILASFGTTVLVVLFMQQLGWDTWLASIEAAQTAMLAGWLGERISSASDAQLLIAGVDGWSILKIGVECSAVIEMAVLAGLVLFYPGLDIARRTKLTAGGLAATYAANLLRLLVIVAIAAASGPDSMFVAHAVVGRTLFFVLVVALYWWMLTRTTLRFVAEEQHTP